MKKIVLLICLIFFSVLSSFSIDCEYTFKMGGRKYCSIMNNDYDIKSYKYDKEINTYSINIIPDMMALNSHERYKSPRNGKYVTHLIYRIEYKNGKMNIKCIGYITGDIKLSSMNDIASYLKYLSTETPMKKPEFKKNIKVFHENDHTYYVYYVNTKIFMERPEFIGKIKEFENMYFNDYSAKFHAELLKSMASNQKD